MNKKHLSIKLILAVLLVATLFGCSKSSNLSSIDDKKDTVIDENTQNRIDKEIATDLYSSILVDMEKADYASVIKSIETYQEDYSDMENINVVNELEYEARNREHWSENLKWIIDTTGLTVDESTILLKIINDIGFYEIKDMWMSIGTGIDNLQAFKIVVVNEINYKYTCVLVIEKRKLIYLYQGNTYYFDIDKGGIVKQERYTPVK